MKVRRMWRRTPAAARSAIDRPHDAACRLRDQPAHPQTDRGGVRLDQNHRRTGEDQVQRQRPCRMGFHLRGGRLQSSAVAEADGGADMSALLVANWSVAGGSSRPIFGIETISISVAPPRSSSAPKGAAKSPSAPCRRRSTSNTAGPPSVSRGPDLMRAMNLGRRNRRTSR